MTSPKAAGQRYIAVADHTHQMAAIARMLVDNLPKAETRSVPTMTVPALGVRIFSIFDSGAKMILPDVGKAFDFTNAKAVTELGWRPRSSQDAVLAAAESLKQLGQLKNAKPAQVK